MSRQIDGRIAARISDRRVLKLIRTFLVAGVMEGGLVGAVGEGVPQGGPLSPLLSNLVLDELDQELDQELEQRGHRFVRYADDSNVYVRTERAGKRVMASLTGFITHRLKLKVNHTKCAIARPWERKFLGFSFTSGPQPRRKIAPKAVGRFKERVRELTGRARDVSLTRMVEDLSPYLRGWRGGGATSAIAKLPQCYAILSPGYDVGFGRRNGRIGSTARGDTRSCASAGCG